MAHHYLVVQTITHSVFCISFLNDVAGSCCHKLKFGKINYLCVFMLLASMATPNQSQSHNVSNRIFKMQNFFVNPYLAYASTQGTGGGGGGGGHGNFVLRMPTVLS